MLIVGDGAAIAQLPLTTLSTYDDKRIKWSGDLKVQLTREKYASYSEQNIKHSLYRPFNKQYLYFDTLLNNSIYLQHLFFPTLASEGERTLLLALLT